MRLFLAFVTTVCVHAAITNATMAGVTAQQAVMSFTCGTGPCTVVVRDLAGNTVDDTSESLFPGSSAAARAGSVLGNNGRITFVAGLRTSQLASDGIMHSRSLATLTSYRATITDTADSSTALLNFTTAAVPTGNLYPEQPPFDANGYGNAAYPTVDIDGGGTGCGNFNGTGKPCIDPVTGLSYWLFTSIGANSALATPFNGSGTSFGTPTLITGSCDVPANMVAAINSLWANCPGAMSATLAAKPWLTAPNTFRPWKAFGIDGTNNLYTPLGSVDDMIVVVSGWASDNTAGDDQLVVSLNGVPGCSITHNVTLPVGTTSADAQTFYVPGAAPTPYWRSWCSPGLGPDQGYAPLPSITVTRVGSGGSVNVGIAYEAATSKDFWNFESLPINCDDGRSVAYDRNGNALTPAVTGYMCYSSPPGGSGEVWLWIPFNADGSIRAESRWLGEVDRSLNVQIAGTVGNSFYGMYGSTGVAKLTYNTNKLNPDTTPYGYCHYQDLRTLTSDPVNGGFYPNNGAGLQPPPCFDFSVVVNNVTSTILTDWATQHPDITDTTNWGGLGVYFFNGLITTNLTPVPNSGNPAMIYGYFDTTGTLLGTGDNWTNHYWNGSAYVQKLGWARAHGPISGTPGQAHAAVNAVSCDSSHPCNGTVAALDGPWSFPVLAVNRAGFGSPVAWDCPGCVGGVSQTASIGPSDLYQCPNTALTRQYCPDGAGGTGSCCVQIQVNHEPCNVTPYIATNTFAGNTKTEPQQFPCTNTDGTTLVNGAWSKLQNTMVGDWMHEMGNSDPNNVDNNWEGFVTVQKDLDGSNNVKDYWLLREASPIANAALWSPFTPHALSVPGFTGWHPCTNYGAGCPQTNTSWSMMMRGGWYQNSSGTWQYPTNGGPPVPDSPQWANCHHAEGPSLRATCSGIGFTTFYQTADYAGSTYGSTIFNPTASAFDSVAAFAKSSAPANTFSVQTYFNVPQAAPAVALIPHNFVVWRHINNPAGGAPYQPSQFCSYTPTTVATDIYLLTGGNCYATTDDPKHIPFSARANPYLLKDVSGPNSVGVFAGTPDAACYALKGGECFAHSQPFSYYVHVASATTANGCSNLRILTRAAGGSPEPCYYSAQSAGGRLEEGDARLFSSDSFSARMLSYAHSIPGGVPQQSFPSWDATGRFVLASGGLIEGRTLQVFAIYVPPMAIDSVKRTTYVPVQITIPNGKAGDTAQVCWGYAENAPGYNPASGLYPMPRQEGGCSDATNAAPFTWQQSDLPHLNACGVGGCTITANLIPGRVAYLQRYKNSAKTGPLQVIAVQ